MPATTTQTEATMTKTVAEYHMVCEVEGCCKTVAQPNGRGFTRFTTCRRHCPETGFVTQVRSEAGRIFRSWT